MRPAAAGSSSHVCAPHTTSAGMSSSPSPGAVFGQVRGRCCAVQARERAL